MPHGTSCSAHNASYHDKLASTAARKAGLIDRTVTKPFSSAMVVDRFPPKHGAVAVACGEQRAAEPTGYANSISQPQSPNNRKLFAIWLAWHEAVSAGERHSGDD